MVLNFWFTNIGLFELQISTKMFFLIVDMLPLLDQMQRMVDADTDKMSVTGNGPLSLAESQRREEPQASITENGIPSQDVSSRGGTKKKGQIVVYRDYKILALFGFG